MPNRLEHRVSKLEANEAAGRVIVAEIHDGQSEQEALDAIGAGPGPNDLVVFLRRFAGPTGRQ